MSALDFLIELGHEEVVLLHDRASGLRGVIAIHDTTFGPAAGGTRMRPYASLDAAVVDALRLSRAMTCKAVMAEVPRGGGKAVIVGDPARDKTPELLAAYGAAVERLGGRFHTGGDMGIDGSDVAVLARHTRHVSHTSADSPFDTADLAAIGVVESIRSTAAFLGRELEGLHVAVQGLGQVGYRVARFLAGEKTRLSVADVDAARVRQAVDELGGTAVDPDAIYDLAADVFSPNASGGVINDATASRLRCKAVVGGANEQLEGARHGDLLHERGILFAPDYVVNAGGLISLLYEIGECDEKGVIERVRAIGPRVRRLLEQAGSERVPPHRLADRLVQERLRERRIKGYPSP